MKKIFLLLMILFFPLCAQSAELPRAAVDYYNAGIDYYQTGNIEKSIQSFKSAIQLSPDFYEAYYNLGQIQFATNKLDEAIATYLKINSLRPSDEENIYSLAQAYYKRGFLSKAVQYYKKITPQSSYYMQAQNDLAKVIARQQELKEQAEAKALIEKQQAEEKLLAAQEKAAANYVNVTSAVTNVAPELNIKTDGVAPKSLSLTKVQAYENIKAPSGITVDNKGNVYIASFAENVIYKIDETGAKAVFARANVSGPVGLAVDDLNNVYVANYNSGNILKINQAGVGAIILTVKNPYIISIKDGFLYISEQVSNTVLKYKLYE